MRTNPAAFSCTTANAIGSIRCIRRYICILPNSPRRSRRKAQEGHWFTPRLLLAPRMSKVLPDGQRLANRRSKGAPTLMMEVHRDDPSRFPDAHLDDASNRLALSFQSSYRL